MENEPKEAEIIINGETLSYSESMTVRNALETFSMHLAEKDALGNDEIGISIRNGYMRNITTIRRKLYKKE